MQLEREIKGISQDYIILWCSWREKSRVLARTILFCGAGIIVLEREIKGISQDYNILFCGAAGERNQGY